MIKENLYQKEKYDSPTLKLHEMKARASFMQTSVGGNSIDSMEEKEVGW